MEVWRGGIATNRVNLETSAVAIGATGAHNNDRRKGACFSFAMDSKGGGKTWTRLFMEADDFAHVARIMMKGAPESARIAFLDALIEQADPTRGRRRFAADRPG